MLSSLIGPLICPDRDITKFWFSCKQTLEMLEKKENVLSKKASLEVEKAKEFTKAKNKRGMNTTCMHDIA